ncbi:hypothetical protein, partial [Burkholderia ubonensis]
VLVPDDAEWRAEPLPCPRIDGPQPATVVGPQGEQIYTDEYGRVFSGSDDGDSETPEDWSRRKVL